MITILHLKNRYSLGIKLGLVHLLAWHWMYEAGVLTVQVGPVNVEYVVSEGKEMGR